MVLTFFKNQDFKPSQNFGENKPGVSSYQFSSQANDFVFSLFLKRRVSHPIYACGYWCKPGTKCPATYHALWKKLSLWSFSKHANMYCTFLHEKVFGTCYEKISFPQVVLLPLAFAFWTWMHWYFSHHKNPGGVKINKRKFWRFSMIHRYFSKIHHSHYNGFIKASQFVTLFARVFYLCTSNMYGMVWYTIVPL